MDIERFILQPYKGPSTRYECPSCHQTHCFTRYIDTEKVIAFPEYVGRCNHENSCGYHYPPRQYFKGNPNAKEEMNSGNVHFHHPSPILPEQMPEPYFFAPSLMDKTMCAYRNNNFYLFLESTFGSEITKRLVQKYHIGTSKLWNGATIFWQVDAQNVIRDGKIMFYDPLTGHRSHNTKRSVNWVHSQIHVGKERIRQCFFGEHLLARDVNSTVAIVESEKTAIIASCFIPQFIWIAVGGKDGMFRQGNFNLLKNRNVIFFPDLGMDMDWRNKVGFCRAQGINAILYEYLKDHASEDQRKAGLDIADFLLSENPQKVILQSLLKKNPAIQTMIRTLHLELEIGESPVKLSPI